MMSAPHPRRSTIFVPLALAALMAAGCGPAVTVAVYGQPTAPLAPRVTEAEIDAGSGRVVVLSPGFFESVVAALPDLEDKVDQRMAAAPPGVALTHEYNMVTAAFERHLIDAGLQPVTQSTVREILRTPGVSAEVRRLAEAETYGISLQQLARAISPAVDAPLALVIRASRISFADEPTVYFADPPGCSVVRLQPLQAAVDALLIRIATGEILWSGEAHVSTSDLLTEPVAFPRGPNRAQFSRDYGRMRLVGQDDGSRCALSMFAGYYCWESGIDSGHCHRDIVPAHPEANAHLVDEVVRLLAETMRVRGAPGADSAAAAPP